MKEKGLKLNTGQSGPHTSSEAERSLWIRASGRIPDQVQVPEGQKQMTEEVKEQTRRKILQTYLPINSEVKTKSKRKQLPCRHSSGSGYPPVWGGMEACFETMCERSVNSKPFSRDSFIYTSHKERKISTVQSEEYYHFSVKAVVVGGGVGRLIEG